MTFENIKKILIPTDGSDYSMRAAEYGISIAKMLNAEIFVLYVIDDTVLDQISQVEQKEIVESQFREDGQRYINFVTESAQQEGVKSSSILSKGRPFEEILHLSKDSNIDLIVMGTYGRTGADRILIGSVAEQVIEYARCPVMVIK